MSLFSQPKHKFVKKFQSGGYLNGPPTAPMGSVPNRTSYSFITHGRPQADLSGLFQARPQQPAATTTAATAAKATELPDYMKDIKGLTSEVEKFGGEYNALRNRISQGITDMGQDYYKTNQGKADFQKMNSLRTTVVGLENRQAFYNKNEAVFSKTSDQYVMDANNRLLAYNTETGKSDYISLKQYGEASTKSEGDEEETPLYYPVKGGDVLSFMNTSGLNPTQVDYNSNMTNMTNMARNLTLDEVEGYLNKQFGSAGFESKDNKITATALGETFAKDVLLQATKSKKNGWLDTALDADGNPQVITRGNLGAVMNKVLNTDFTNPYMQTILKEQLKLHGNDIEAARQGTVEYINNTFLKYLQIDESIENKETSSGSLEGSPGSNNGILSLPTQLSQEVAFSVGLTNSAQDDVVALPYTVKPDENGEWSSNLPKDEEGNDIVTTTKLMVTEDKLLLNAFNKDLKEQKSETGRSANDPVDARIFNKESFTNRMDVSKMRSWENDKLNAENFVYDSKNAPRLTTIPVHLSTGLTLEQDDPLMQDYSRYMGDLEKLEKEYNDKLADPRAVAAGTTEQPAESLISEYNKKITALQDEYAPTGIFKEIGQQSVYIVSGYYEHDKAKLDRDGDGNPDFADDNFNTGYDANDNYSDVLDGSDKDMYLTSQYDKQGNLKRPIPNAEAVEDWITNHNPDANVDDNYSNSYYRMDVIIPMNTPEELKVYFDNIWISKANHTPQNIAAFAKQNNIIPLEVAGQSVLRKHTEQ
jgi:hypothetical protein